MKIRNRAKFKVLFTPAQTLLQANQSNFDSEIIKLNYLPQKNVFANIVHLKCGKIPGG